MGLEKNTTGQKIDVFAFDLTTGDPVAGDVANITGKICQDGGSAVAFDTPAPTEQETGHYVFSPTQAETNADTLKTIAVSTTANVGFRVVTGDGNTTVSQTIVLPQQFLATADDGNQDSGTFADTHIPDDSYISIAGSSVSFIIDFAIGSGNVPYEIYIVVKHSANGSRTGLWQMYNFNLAGFETIRDLPNTGINEIYGTQIFPSGNAAHYVDGAGNAQFRFVTDPNTSSTVECDYATVNCLTEAGNVPTASEIAVAVELVNSAVHGHGNHEGDYTKVFEIESITTQLEFVLTGSVEGLKAGSFFIVYDGEALSNSAQFGAAYIENYQADTPSAGLATVTIANVMDFTVTVDMRTQIRLNPPVNVDAIVGDRTAAPNLRDMFNGTGYTDPTAPSSRTQLDNLSGSSGGGINFPPDGDNTGGAIKGAIFAGIETGTFLNMANDDGSYHTIDHVGDDIDIVYTYSIGGSRTGITATYRGYLLSINDAMFIQAYNHVGLSWETVKDLPGTGMAADVTLPFTLYPRHTGTTGADRGKVYLRFEANGAMTTPQLNGNQLFVEAISNTDSIGYLRGAAVWYDSNVSPPNAGSEKFVDGQANTAVSDVTALRSLADQLGLKEYHQVSGSILTPEVTHDNWFFNGIGGEVRLNNQQYSGTTFDRQIISGIGTGADEQTFLQCTFVGLTTLDFPRLSECDIKSTIKVVTSGKQVQIFRCINSSGSIQTIDMDNQGNNNVIMTVDGDFEFENLATTDTVQYFGIGTLRFNVNCLGGTVNIYGNPMVVDNSGGNVTIINNSANTKLLAIQGAGFNTSTDSLEAIRNQGDFAWTTATGFSTFNPGVDQVTVNALTTAAHDDMWSTFDLTESYAANTEVGTPAQMMYAIQQAVTHFFIVNDKISVKKLGGTEAFEINMDDDTNPTSRERI